MNQTSAKKSISHLVKIIEAKGLKHVVISPGSRNAALTISFAENPAFQCYNIPDERVAAFFALGIALKLHEPVVICCTSGSAALNYAPAISEALYQKVPLLILTADRPIEWVDQRAGQTIRQNGIFDNYVKKSFNLMGQVQLEDHLWYNDRLVNEAVEMCTSGAAGPVHINVPMKEPLYDLVDASSVAHPKLMERISPNLSFSQAQLKKLFDEWKTYNSILVIIGQDSPNSRLSKLVDQLAILKQVVVLTETTSNIHSDHVLPSIDRVIDGIRSDEYAHFEPQLILSFGNAIVSKKLRFMLRQMNVKAHWQIDPYDNYVDTYQALTKLLPVAPTTLLEKLLLFEAEKSTFQEASKFKMAWLDREVRTKSAHDEYMKNCVWSDLLVVAKTIKSIPSGSVHFASSTPVRYAQLFPPREDLVYRCNRGVSGIDGCTSTAVGYANASNDLVTLITGDLAFFYDSNGLWHSHLPNNLRIIMINNQGGNIFRYVKGPSKTAHLETHFEATHKTEADGIARSFGLDYRRVAEENKLEQGLSWLFDDLGGECRLLEIATPRIESIPILKDYFTYLNKQSH